MAPPRAFAFVPICGAPAADARVMTGRDRRAVTAARGGHGRASAARIHSCPPPPSPALWLKNVDFERDISNAQLHTDRRSIFVSFPGVGMCVSEIKKVAVALTDSAQRTTASSTLCPGCPGPSLSISAMILNIVWTSFDFDSNIFGEISAAENNH